MLPRDLLYTKVTSAARNPYARQGNNIPFDREGARSKSEEEAKSEESCQEVG